LDNLTERIAWAIKVIKIEKTLDQGITDVELSKKLGTNKDTLASYRKGKGLLKGEVIDRISKLYKFNPLWLFYGKGEPFPGARSKYPEVCGPDEPVVINNQWPMMVRETAEGAEYTRDPEFIYVPQMGGRISAGGGLVPDNTVEVRLAFRKEWILRKGDPRYMSLIRVSGDSMDPTLQSGDLVLIDHNRNTLDPQGGIYAVAVDDIIMIKRLHADFTSKKIYIISDNERYSAIQVDFDQVKINGKVIWFGRELER